MASKPKITLKIPYMRKRIVIRSATLGDVLTRSDQESPVKFWYSAVMIGIDPGPIKCSGAKAAIAPQVINPASAIKISIQANIGTRLIVTVIAEF